MRTLTASATTKKNARTWEVDWLLESPPLGMHLSSAYEGVTGGPTPDTSGMFAGPWDFAFDIMSASVGVETEWEHRLTELGEVKQSIPPGGGIAAVHSLQASVIDNGAGQSPSNIWNLVERLEGQPLQLSMLFAGEEYANRIPLWGGEIEHVSWDAEGEAQIQGVDHSLPADLELPQVLVTTQSFPDAPEHAVNQALPIIYGSGEPGRLELVPLLLIDKVRFVRYRAAWHPLAMMSPLVGVFPSGATKPKTTLATIASAPNAEIILGAALTTILFGGAGIDAVPRIARQLDVINANYAIDGNPDTLAIISTDTFIDPANLNGHGQLGLKLTFASPEGANMATVTLRNFRRSPESLTPVVGQFRLRTLNEFDEVIVDGLWESQPYRHVSNPDTKTFTIKPIALDAGSALEALLDVHYEGGRGGPLDTFEIGEFGVTLGYQPDSPLEQLFLDGTSSLQFAGRSDIAGTITGTQNGRIDNPADVIRSVILDEIYQPINALSFDIARSLLAPQVFDGGVGAGWSHDRISAVQWLGDMAQQCRSYLIPDGTGAFRLVPYNANTSAVHPLSQDNILISNPESDPAEWQSSFTYDNSDTSIIYNDIRVEYGWHPGTRQYSKNVYANPEGSNHSTEAANLGTRCADSYSRYGKRKAMVVQAYMISQQATAELLLKHLVEYYWSQHCFVSCETTLAACHVEAGDFVAVSHPRVPTLVYGLPFEVLESTFHPSRGTIFLRCTRQLALTFDYFAITDQAGVTWYWWINNAGELSWHGNAPGTPVRSAQNLNLSPIPSWLQVQDTGGNTRYVYPLQSGEPFAATAAPAVGTGMVGSPTVNGLALGNWQIGVSQGREPYAQRV